MEVMVYKRIWDEYMNVKGGDFSNWYEGLSPIEEKAWKIKFKMMQNSEVRKYWCDCASYWCRIFR